MTFSYFTSSVPDKIATMIEYSRMKKACERMTSPTSYPIVSFSSGCRLYVRGRQI